ncbi:MAG: hypothetical protein KF809_15070 [Chloroflexi bacterium]|nr:hypothetical protein [Chloroflexota bacterium]
MARGERRRGTPEEEALIAARRDLWQGLHGHRYMPGETVRWVQLLDQAREAGPHEILLDEEILFMGPRLRPGQESLGWVVVGYPALVLPVVGIRRRRRGDPRPYGPPVPGAPDVERTIRRVLRQQGVAGQRGSDEVVGDGPDLDAHGGAG